MLTLPKCAWLIYPFLQMFNLIFKAFLFPATTPTQAIKRTQKNAHANARTPTQRAHDDNQHRTC